jgi:two-component system cell cycle response regulator
MDHKTLINKARDDLDDSVVDGACLVQIYGPDLGKKIALTNGSTTIGRGSSCGIVLDLENVSRLHCSVRLRGGGAFLRDEGSTNGTFLNNAEIKTESRLASGDLIKVGSAIFKFLGNGRGELGSIEARYHEEIYRLTIIDGLTQVHNKRYLLEFLEREMARCARHERTMSLVLLDIDHFKQVNDQFGHLAGDAVLRDLAALLKARMRKEECLARYGGEEFALVLPETNRENAMLLAGRLRRLTQMHRFLFEGKRLPVTFSAGVAELRPGPLTALEFLKLADERLYEAKHKGRNQVAG